MTTKERIELAGKMRQIKGHLCKCQCFEDASACEFAARELEREAGAAWIPHSERYPTEADADANGSVMELCGDGRVRMVPWRDCLHGQGWMRIPMAPKPKTQGEKDQIAMKAEALRYYGAIDFEGQMKGIVPDAFAHAWMNAIALDRKVTAP